MSVRVRYAPSPTGFNHSGGIRTALYNYLFAKKHGGTFILRIEDTDSKRFVPAAEQYIKDSLEWIGIIPDESPWNPNPDFGSYRQSERAAAGVYTPYVNQLIKSGHAYYAFDTESEIKVAFGFGESYSASNRMNMRNSLSLPADEVTELLLSGAPHVVRFKVPENTTIVTDDEIRGLTNFRTDTMDDKVLIKSDGIPTYHLASVIDDHLMDITHVFRGEEWLPSYPFHVLLYDALGWIHPYFIHLPTVLNPDGKGKLSKRTAAAKGFEIFPLEVDTTDEKDNPVHFEGYKKLGYEPEAYMNFLALLGHTFTKDTLTRDEMIAEFDIEKLHISPAIFDTTKLAHINKFHLREVITRFPGQVWFDVMGDDAPHIGALDYVLDDIFPRLKTRLDIPTFVYPFLSHTKTMEISEETKKLLIIFKEMYGDGYGNFSGATMFSAWMEDFHVNKKEMREVVCSSQSGSSVAFVFAIIGMTEFINRVNKYL